ncbi:MAG: endonuclease III domain-containing protein [Candidatus Mycalebacterium zealandia]|nr:MAG: endonuclease III domain-containing protein [Candidatus Mycalebacterium zealandia]
MFERYGAQNWWPAQTAFECVVGAILTQNTAWTNVEKAIAQLKSETEITPGKIDKMPAAKLARLIKPSGYFNQKARRLKIFARFVARDYGGNIGALLTEETGKLRKILLALEGIGPETTDSIILYAAEKPVFVIDAYTKRIASRHGFAPQSASYGEAQELFAVNLPRETELFNEYHALIVRTAKQFCHKKEPDCENCPLKNDLTHSGATHP